MDVGQIKGLGRRLNGFLGEFDDCFSRSEPRADLRAYVRGQLSDLQRKSIEPIALAAGMSPRTLQCFFSDGYWNQELMRDRMQQIVARDHAHPRAIGAIDETGNPKKGEHTAAVQPQYCGHTGKIDNCVVAVHWAYLAGDFACLMDSELFLSEEWANDGDRRRAAGIPDEVAYRKKARIALEQVRRALSNGVRVSAWTFDSLYGGDGEFLDGLDALGQSYVGQIPKDFFGWLRPPQVLVKPTGGGAKKRRFPRLARKTLPPCAVENLVTYSPEFREQQWRRYRVKDTERGPMVWEVKVHRFYRKHGDAGLPGPTHTLIVARNVLDPTEIKYFLSNLVAGRDGATVEWMLWVAFGRFGVERCFEVGKRDLGMDHFEMRCWLGIHRHLYISQLSLLFCAREHQRLREKNDGLGLPDRRAGAGGRQRLPGRPELPAPVSDGGLPERGPADPLLPTPQPAVPQGGPPQDPAAAPSTGHQTRLAEILRASRLVAQVAL
jgi:SRSO17 transposase